MPTPDDIARFEECAKTSVEKGTFIEGMALATGDTRGPGWTAERRNDFAKMLKDSGATITELLNIIKDLTETPEPERKIPLNRKEKSLVAKSLSALYQIEHEEVSAIADQLSSLLTISDDPVHSASSKLNSCLKEE